MLSGDMDGTNNTSETINKALKAYFTTGKKTRNTVLRAIFEFKYQHHRTLTKRLANPRKRSGSLIKKYDDIINVLLHYNTLTYEVQKNHLIRILELLGSI